MNEIVEMSMKFMATTGYKDFSTQPDIESLVLNILTSPQDQKIIILEPGEGFVAGITSKFPFGPDLVASEIAWWVDPEKRGSGLGLHLLQAFEYWAKEKAGCKMLSMVTLSEGLEKLYLKQGYKLYERAYMKVL